MPKRYASLPVFCFILSLSVFLIHFSFFRHSFPENNIDEVSFFSPAYSLAEKGKLSTDIHASFLPGASEYTYWMPPLHMTVLGIIFMMVGPSVFIAKLVSFIYVVLAAFLLSSIVPGRISKIWMASILLICPFVIICSAFIRMEALALLIVSATILAVKSETRSPYLGILAALAIMTHPLLIACAAALAFVIIKRGVVPFIAFSLVFLAVISPYLYYISLDFDLFKAQMELQLLRKSTKGLSSFNIAYILQSLPLAIAATFLLWKIKKHTGLKYFLFVGMLISLILIIKSGEFNYHVYLVPYVIAIIGLYIEENQENITGSLIMPFAFYMCFGLFLCSKAYSAKIQTNEAYHELLQLLDRKPEWKGKNIYVYGIPDIAIHLILKDQKVERLNAVASVKKNNWSLKYNYVIRAIDNNWPQPQEENLPWQSWKEKSTYTTSKGHYTLITYSRD